MNNNKAIEIIADFEKHIIPCDEYGYRIDSDLMEAHSMAVKALRNAWIPVTERLPEEMKPVLAWCGEGYFAECARWTGRRWVKMWDFEDLTGVTHWMPLPKPPKEENK